MRIIAGGRMLNQLALVLEEQGDLNYNMGSILHGYLMEQVGKEYGNCLHESQLKPFSQSLYFERKSRKWVWVINTLNLEAYENLMMPMLNKGVIELNHQGKKLKVVEQIEKEPLSYETLTRQYYLSDDSRKIINIIFLTPCSFKVKNEYLMYPSLLHIYQSLMQKFSQFSTTIKIDDKTVLNHLTEHTSMVGYRLKSSKYCIGKGLIKGYSGEIRLKIDGNETIRNLGNLLFAFGNYSGVGIKTSLGMGAMNSNL